MTIQVETFSNVYFYLVFMKFMKKKPPIPLKKGSYKNFSYKKNF